MTSFELVLLGGFQARAAGRVIDVPGRKERALLALLALPPGERRSRDRLAGLLWGDRGDKQAGDSLRQAILRLRKAFDPVQPLPLLTDRGSVTLDRAMVAVDVQDFEQLIAKRTPQAVARAISLYRGDLLEGLDIGDPAFEEWLQVERQRLRDMAREALSTLLESHLSGGERDQAGAVARRLLTLDPLREAAHRALMKIYAEQGQAALALKQYQLCHDALQTELGVRPEAETERLYRSIKEKRAPSRGTPGQASAAAFVAGSGSALVQPLVAHNVDVAGKPAVAVLPFINMSGDPEQEYFSDGITEDIISGLARMHWLLVIARDSSFVYKGKTVDVKQVDRELGVRYLLEGSVRKAEDRVRITTQLVDATTGAHIWTERFDGTLKDIFDLQDRVAASVLGAIEPRLRHAEIERARRKPTESIDAYDLFLRAVALNYTRKLEDNKEALLLLKRAIEIDQSFAAAYGLAAFCSVRQRAQGWIHPSDPMIVEGIRMARLAAETGQDNPEALWMAGLAISLLVGDHEGGLSLIQRSLTINPNSANAWMSSGFALGYLGDTEMALGHLERSARLSPLDPLAYATWQASAVAHFIARRYEEASAWCDKTLHEAPNYPPAIRMKAACCGLLDRLEEGSMWVRRLLDVNPNADLSSLRTYYEVIMKKPGSLDAVLDGLRKAGLPE